MEWYWWVLIAVGVYVIGYMKLKVWSKMKAKRKKSQQDTEE